MKRQLLFFSGFTLLVLLVGGYFSANIFKHVQDSSQSANQAVLTVSTANPNAPLHTQKTTIKSTTAPKPAKKVVPQPKKSGTAHLPLFLIGLYIFILSIFVGFEVITKVPATLHTPLMSGANAISGITIVGALSCLQTNSGFAQFLGFLAVVFAMINVVGGFLVTDRMLKMFQKK